MTSIISPPETPLPLAGVARELEDLRRLVHYRWRVHSTLSTVYGFASNFLIITGIAATAIAGVTAAGNLLGKTAVGAVAMAAAVVTAVGAGLPWQQRASDHSESASDYLSLRDEIGTRQIELESGTSERTVRDWCAIRADLTAQRERVDRKASQVPLLRGSRSRMGR